MVSSVLIAYNTANGEEYFYIAILLLFTVIYISSLLLVKKLRNKSGMGLIAVSAAAAWAVCDAAWYFYYFDGTEYINRGIGGITASAVFPVLLVAAAITVIYLQKKK